MKDTKDDAHQQFEPPPIDASTIDHLTMALGVLAEPDEFDAVMASVTQGRTRKEATAELERIQGFHWTIIRAGNPDLLKRWEKILHEYIARTRPFDTARWDWLEETNQVRLMFEGVPTDAVE